MTDEIVRWHHGLNGDECEQTPGNSERQGSLECYSPFTKVEYDLMTEQQQQTLQEISWHTDDLCLRKLKNGLNVPFNLQCL